MKKIYFTVGPSQISPSVYAHIEQGLKEDILSLSHTGKDFIDLYKRVSSELKLLFNIPETYRVFFTGSSTESMERIINNTVYKKSAHLITGGFAQKFYKTAIDLRKHPVPIEIPLDKESNFPELHIPQDTELLCITENDTSTGMRIPLEAFSSIKKNNPGLLIAVDIVSSIPYVKVDYSIIDLAFFSIHKGLGLPAGLGILIVSEAAIEKAQFLYKKGVAIGSHHSFISLAEKEEIFKTPATPNVFYIYLLEKVIHDMSTKGIEGIRLETEKKAKMIYDFFNKHDRYKPIVHELYRSLTTPVIDVQGNAEHIADRLAERGLIISKGYGANSNQHIRIANFPSITEKHIKNLLISMEKCLD